MKGWSDLGRPVGACASSARLKWAPNLPGGFAAHASQPRLSTGQSHQVGKWSIT
ncbi:unannotated protein [freshwater metagenome]|uniref:Unannotated protein n=1 Tax=freshwater metagenome TaxID=449393 RepID=A0A6J6TH25_9ZZZZ